MFEISIHLSSEELNCLSFQKRVQYNACLMVYNSTNNQAPDFMSFLVSLLWWSSQTEKKNNQQKLMVEIDLWLMHCIRFDWLSTMGSGAGQMW